jgi:curved DNA binding protein
MSDVEKEEVDSENESEDEEEKKAQEEEDTSLAVSDVVTKYQEAAKITQAALTMIISKCVPGAKVIDLCKEGDELMEEKLAGIYKTKKGGKTIEKGLAFPVCLSVNECVCHFSPLASDPEQVELAAGDMVKIDLGCHIDGYIAVAAHTVEVGYVANPSAPVTGIKADLWHCAYHCAEVATRMMRPGNKNGQITEAMKKICEAFGVQSITGTLMHQMKRYVIDGNKMVLLREEPEHKVDQCTFEANEVYAIDIAVSSGEGKPRELDARTTVFKRVVDQTYALRIKGSRQFFNEVNKRFPTLPFSIRSFSDERNARLGIRECVAHNLLVAYPVLYERTGDLMVHIKVTVLIMPNGNIKITGVNMPEGYQTEKTLPEDIVKWLEDNPAPVKKDRKKKK